MQCTGVNMHTYTHTHTHARQLTRRRILPARKTVERFEFDSALILFDSLGKINFVENMPTNQREFHKNYLRICECKINGDYFQKFLCREARWRQITVITRKEENADCEIFFTIGSSTGTETWIFSHTRKQSSFCTRWKAFTPATTATATHLRTRYHPLTKLNKKKVDNVPACLLIGTRTSQPTRARPPARPCTSPLATSSLFSTSFTKVPGSVAFVSYSALLIPILRDSK